MSAPVDMMTLRTGSPDIMSMRSDLRKPAKITCADMMTGFERRAHSASRDLRKRSPRTVPASFKVIMSGPNPSVTARSGRRSP
jgi:hypothetical protein